MNDKKREDDVENESNKKDCPLPVKEWIILLNSEINNGEGALNQDIATPTVNLFITAILSITAIMLAVRTTNLPANDINYILFNIGKSMYSLVFLFIFFIFYIVYKLYFILPKTHKKVTVLKNIRKRILDGNLIESNEIRKEWETTQKEGNKLPINKDTFNNMKSFFNLDCTEHKTRLIELLLIVGSLVVAFKTPDDLTSGSIAIKGSLITMFFMIFVIFSILYFILIQKEIKEDSKKIKPINYSSFIVAVSFSTIMANLLALSAIKDITIPLLEVGSYLIIFIVYCLSLTFFIWAALRIDYDKNNKKT